MKTVNKYGLEYAGPRRARRGALRQWLMDLIIGAVAMALLWWLVSMVSRAATVGDVMPPLRMAGFGVADWIAYGVLGTVVMSLLALIAWNAIVGPRPAMEDGEGWSDAVVPDVEELAEPWMAELQALMAQRHVLVSMKQCRQIRALCVPRHRMDLVMLDAFLRRELGLRLFVTSLKEVQAICGKAGKEGLVS